MTHQFAVGDIVRLNQNILHAEIIGFEESPDGLLLHVRLVGGSHTMYFPVKAVTLVRSASEAETNHPGKIETDAKARDVTTAWDGGYKIHEPRKMET